jgi:hypothetical protein
VNAEVKLSSDAAESSHCFIFVYCKFFVLHDASMNNEGSSLLGYDAGSFGEWFLIFQRHYIPLSTRKGTSYIQ